MGTQKVNWSLCCLCQTNDGGEIRCPAKSKRKDIGAGYKSLSDALSQFEGSYNGPINIPQSLLNDANLQQTLMTNHAIFHKSCFNKLSRVCSKIKRPYDAEPAQASPAKTRKTSRCSTSSLVGGICLFCGIDDPEKMIHSVSSTECDLTVRAWATNLDDFNMLGELANGDLFAHDTVYHKECMTKYYTRHRSCLRKKHSEGKISQSELEGIALAETVAYVTESDSDGPFYISELAELYKTRLDELGGTVPTRVHTPRFQERILSQIPWMKGLKAHDKKLYIACENAIGKVAAQELYQSPDQNACNMARTAIHLREHIFDSKQKFDGKFPANIQEESVPHILSSFIDMVLCGPSVKRHKVEDRKSVALCIAELLIYNAVKKTPTKSVTNIRHKADRETPLAIYIALKVYGATEHSEDTINRLHELGICISYARVREISKVMANSVIKMFETEGVACGTILKKGLLTIGSADNIDINPSNRDAKEALHGTGCALTQLPTLSNMGIVRSAEQYREAARTLPKIARLPRFYTDIKEVSVTDKLTPVAVTGPCRPTPSVPVNAPPVVPSETTESVPVNAPSVVLSETTESVPVNAPPVIPSEITESAVPQNVTNLQSEVEEHWITHAQSIIERNHLNHDDVVSWAAYCASNLPQYDRPPCITSMLPIFRDKASTSPMIYHAMSIIKAATEHLNPGQTPVITLDQPLYAIAKAIQWDSATEFNEDNYCVFLGLSTQKCSLKSCWVTGYEIVVGLQCLSRLM